MKKTAFKILLFGFFASLLAGIIFIPANIDLQKIKKIEVKTVASAIQTNTALAYDRGSATQLTKALSDKTGEGKWIWDLYKLCLGFLDVGLVAALVIIALANILHWKIDTYAIKIVMPRIIVVAIAANLAMAAFILASKLVDSLHSINILRVTDLDFAYLTRGMDLKTMAVWGLIALVASVVTGGISGLGVCLGFLIWLGAVIIIFLLHLILAFRPYVIYLAAALSPLAIGCYILPQTQQFFKKWLTISIVWMIMPLVVFGIINLGYKVPVDTTGGHGLIASLVGWVLPALIRAGLLIVAIRFPFSIEKDVSGAIHWLGKQAGTGALTLGATGADKIYKWNTARTQRAMTTARDAAVKGYEKVGAGGKSRKQRMVDFRAAQLERQIRRESPTMKDEDVRKKARLQAETEVDQRIRGKAMEAATNARNKFRGGWNYNLTNAGASLLSLPLGITVGLQTKKENDQKEREKTSQKVLMDFTNPFLWRTKLEQKNPALRWLSGRLLSPEMMRGRIGDIKYYQGIAKEDLTGRLSPEQILAYGLGYTFDLLIEKVTGKNRADVSKEEAEQAMEIIAATLDDLNDKAESGGTWDDNPLLSELGHKQVADLSIAYRRYREELERQAYGFGGISGRTERRFQAKQAMINMAAGGPSGALGGEGTAPPEGAALDPKVTSYLSQIATQTKGLGGGLAKFAGAIEAAERADLSSAQVQSLGSHSDTTLRDISTRMRLAGVADTAMIRAIKGLDGASPLTIEETVQSVKSDPEIVRAAKSDPQIVKLIDDYSSARTAHFGALHATEGAQSIERIAVELVPKLDETAARQLQQACETVLKVKVLPDVQISPDQFQQAARVIQTHMPKAVIRQTTQAGEQLDVSTSTAAKIAKAIEVGRIGE